MSKTTFCALVVDECHYAVSDTGAASLFMNRCWDALDQDRIESKLEREAQRNSEYRRLLDKYNNNWSKMPRKELETRANLVVLNVSATPYALQTRQSRIDINSEVGWAVAEERVSGFCCLLCILTFRCVPLQRLKNGDEFFLYSFDRRRMVADAAGWLKALEKADQRPPKELERQGLQLRFRFTSSMEGESSIALPLRLEAVGPNGCYTFFHCSACCYHCSLAVSCCSSS